MTKIKYKLISMLVLVTLISSLGLGGYGIYSTYKQSEELHELQRQTLYQDYDKLIKHQVETVVSLIDNVYSDYLDGNYPSEEAAKRVAADLVRDLRYDKEGYFWVDTLDGYNIVLLGRDKEGTLRINDKDPNGVEYVKEFVTNAQKEGGGYTDYQFPKANNGELFPKRGYTLAFKPWGWSIGTGNYVDDIEAVLSNQWNHIQREMKGRLAFYVLFILGVALVSVISGTVFSRKIANQLSEVTQVAEAVSAGNLQVRPINISSKDEIGTVGQAINHMVINLKDLITEVLNLSSQVATSSEQLAKGSEQLAQASNQVSSSITEVAGNTENQMNAVSEASTVVAQISSSMNQIQLNSKNVANTSSEAASSASQGERYVESAINQMASIEQTVDNLAKVVGNLGERSTEIGQIVDAITTIAGQTNLLALNAAIEAARAGEHGKGFAVVAEEVRKLAEQSEVAAKQISELILQIQKDTDTAVQAMTEGSREVKVGTEVVNNAGQTFREIVSLINKVSAQITEIAQEIEQMNHGTEKIVTSVRDIEYISRDTDGQTQTVSAAVEEQTASIEEIAASSQSLTDMAEQLQRAVKKFNL